MFELFSCRLCFGTIHKRYISEKVNFFLKSEDFPQEFLYPFIDTEPNIKYLNVSGGFELNSFLTLSFQLEAPSSAKKGGTEWDPGANSVYS